MSRNQLRHISRATIAITMLCVPCALAQSLLRIEPPKPALDEKKKPADSENLQGYSLTLVQPPEQRQFRVHDQVMILIQEQSRQTSSAKLDTKTDSSIEGSIKELPDLIKLLELRLEGGERSNLAGVDAEGKNKFKGDGKYERSEGMSDRIQAVVIDVKPNGTIVLEARRSMTKDDQTQTVVVSGIARQEDITTGNTVLSSQLAELTVKVESEGDVDDAAKKGWLTNIFETIFNF
jgi:flagellar L-ring protein FlgH